MAIIANHSKVSPHGVAGAGAGASTNNPCNSSSSSSSSSNKNSNNTARRWPPSASPRGRRRLSMAIAGVFVAAGTALMLAPLLPKTGAQPEKYMDGAAWKKFLGGGGVDNADWFAHWNAMAQPRIDRLTSFVESLEGETTSGGGGARPFRVAMIGDSTMMQQHGVLCAFLGERPGRRFDPAVHQKECCVDTLPRGQGAGVQATPDPAHDENNSDNDNEPALDLGKGGGGESGDGGGGGGRGLCFRHTFQRFSELHDWESALGSPDAVYFGSGLHLLHMTRPGHGSLEAPKVQGWLNYERDLEHAVEAYREKGGDNMRLIFMTPHAIEESVYEGDFRVVIDAYRDNDVAFIADCERQTRPAAHGATGPQGYGVDDYCRQALMDRNGSDVLSRRSRAVMARLGVPLVEGDLIVRDQAWATPRTDGRHYHFLVPIEVWELLGVLTSPFAS